MLPIWLITIATMLGTGLVSYSISLQKLGALHNINMEQVKKVEYRTAKLTEYKNILEKDGKEAALEFIKQQ